MAPIQSKPRWSSDKAHEEDLVERKMKSIGEVLLKILHKSLVQAGQVWTQAGSLLGQLGPLVDKFVRSSVVFLESYCCLDLRRYARGPEPKLHSSLPILFVLFLFMMLYNAFVFCYMPMAGIAFNSPTSLLFHAFVFLVLASFVQAVRTDPGGIPEGQEWRTYGQPPSEVRQRKHGCDEARWCRKSKAYKPDRAHYCRVLNRCVLRMDHHCPWLGNTVGFSNHKFFFLFLFYASSACSLLGIGIVQLLVHATLPALTTFLLIGAEGLTLLLSCILVPFLLFHTWLLARNMTTIEFCEMMRSWGGEDEETSGSAFDMGIFANICSVMGKNPLMWWVPLGSPMGDGISFVPSDACEATPVARLGRTVGSCSAAEAREDDPEAVHPAVFGSEEEDEDQRSRGGSRSVGGTCPSASAGSASGASPKSGATPEGCAESFLVWHSADEFTGDLRLGCETIGKSFFDSALSLHDSALRLARLCTEGRPSWRKQRRSSAAKAGPARPSPLSIVRVDSSRACATRHGGGSSAPEPSSQGSRRSHGSGMECFLRPHVTSDVRAHSGRACAAGRVAGYSASEAGSQYSEGSHASHVEFLGRLRKAPKPWPARHGGEVVSDSGCSHGSGHSRCSGRDFFSP